MASIFTRIINGEMPGHFIWKDELAVAIMTIAPIRPGHCLVIPREEVNHWDDVPAETAAHLMLVSQKIAKGLKVVYQPKRVGIMVAGLEVPHTHIHLLPIDAIPDLDFSKQRAEDAETLAGEARKVRDALKAQGWAEADC